MGDRERESWARARAAPFRPLAKERLRGPSPPAGNTCPVLLELNVENLLLIERAQLRLAPGLNAITGETGAGKTVLAHALDLLLGGRARPGIVRPGAGEAYVEGVFELPGELRAQLPSELAERLGADLGEGEEGAADVREIVLARRVGADGRRTRAYVNGRAATVGELREVAAPLLAYYGQHEHRRLTVAGAQLGLLDGLCGPEQAERLRACAQAHRECQELEGELRELGELAAARERELDLLGHELAEIEQGAIEEGEHERLRAARERLRRSEALCGAAASAGQALAPESGEEPGAATLLAGAAGCLEEVAEADPALAELARRLVAAALEARDVAGELRRYGEGLAGEEGSLEEVEGRLAAMERLMRKHGGSPAEVLAYGERARARVTELTGAESALARTRERLEQAQAARERLGSELRGAREQAAPRLARGVREQLAALGMAEAEFEVVLFERAPGPNGGDGVEMLIAPNPGVPAGPLREIASGGELSRVMLAVIAAAGAGAGARLSGTLVFDEIDAGIGGQTARAVGERLRALGRAGQVLCITHLPQIASLAERHFAVVKDTSAEPTRATVLELGEGQVVSELVRMLGADSDDGAARRHARDLRRAA